MCCECVVLSVAAHWTARAAPFLQARTVKDVLTEDCEKPSGLVHALEADRSNKAAAAAEEATRKASALAEQFKDLRLEHSETTAALSALERESARNAQKATAASELARTLTKQYKEEKTVNDSLLTRIKHLERVVADAEARVKELEAQKADLEEQNHDLSMFISGAQKIKEMQANEVFGLQEGEVEGGTIEVGKKRKGKGKKKT